MYGYEPVLHLATHPKLEIIKRDIRNGVDKLEQYDIIFHLAGISGFPACASNPHLYTIDKCRSNTITWEISKQRPNTDQCFNYFGLWEIRLTMR